MSLNDKYIINGSTLSDIGDALRAKSIIAPTKEVTQQVCCYRTSFSTSRDNYGNYKESTTLTEWSIQYQQYGVNWGYPVPQFSYVRIYRETNSYSMKVNGATLAAGSSVIVSLPCTLLFEGNYTCYVKFYPLDSNQNEIPWDSSYYYPSNPNDYNVHYYKENITKQVPNLIEVGDMADAITNAAGLSAIKYKFKWIKIGYYVSGSSYATSLGGLGITRMQDIICIAMLVDQNPSTWWVLTPETASTWYEGSLSTNDSGGDYSNVTWYKGRTYSTSSSMYTGNGNATDAKWEKNGSDNGYFYFQPNRKALVSRATSTQYISYYHPAIIIYKPSGTETE